MLAGERAAPGPRVRVLHLIEHLEIGGAERVVANLIRTLDPARFESVACHYRLHGLLAEELAAEGYAVRYLEKDLLRSRLPPALRRWAAPLVVPESLLFVGRLAALMRREKIDIVHTHLFSANLWGRLAATAAGCRATITTEHTRREREGSLKRSVLNRLLLRCTDRVVAVSDEVARGVAALQGIPPGLLTVIPNGVRLDQAPPPEAGSRLDGGAPVIAAIGRLAPEKRLDLLLQALVLLGRTSPGVRCLILGTGPERGSLEALARDLGLGGRVEFLGEQRCVESFFPSLAAVVNCSDREGLPLSLLEAMAAGVPVVATDVGGNPEIVRDGETGILVPPGDPGSLAAGIGRMLSNPRAAGAMAAAARALVRQRHSLAAMAGRYEQLYEEVLRTGRRARKTPGVRRRSG